MQIASFPRFIKFPPAICLTLPYFSTSSIKRYIFRKKIVENKICLFIYSTSFAWNISILIIILKDIIIKAHIYLVKFTLYLPYFNLTWVFWTDFLKTFKYQISRKFNKLGSRFYMRTDRHYKGNSRSWLFCEGASNLYLT